MKLLYIDQYFIFPSDAGGTRSYDLALSFVKQGIDVTIISSIAKEDGRKGWEYLEREGIKFYLYHCLYNNHMSFSQRIRSFLKFMFAASLKSLKLNYDVVLATSTPLSVAVPALISKCIKRRPFIFEARDVWPEVPIKMGFIKNRFAIKGLYWFERMVYKNASAIVPLSIGMEANIQTRYPNTKSVVIPNISQIERFSKIAPIKGLKLPDTTGKTVILYAGTFGIVNGISYVVDLAGKLKDKSNIVFFLFGDGREKESVMNKSKRNGTFNKNVFFFDPVRKQDLPYLYSIADFGSSFVIDNPVLWDNSANKFFDTLAAGRAMLINHEGWQANIIREKEMGYVLPANLTDETVKKFIEYAENKDKTKKAGVKALECAKQEFSLDIAVMKYMSIFNSIK